MKKEDLGYALREPGGTPFLYLTGTVVLEGNHSKVGQETHMRPPENGWRRAHVLIKEGVLMVWCEKLTYRFKYIGEDIECLTSNGGRVILDARSTDLIRCIESQVEGNLKKPEPIKHRNKVLKS